MNYVRQLIVLLAASLLLNVSCTSLGGSNGVEGERDTDLGTEYLYRALNIWEEHRIPERIELLERSTEMAPNALAHFMLAELEEKQGQWDRARASYSAAVEIDPGFAAAYHRRGLIDLWKTESSEEQREAALADLLKAWNLAPDFAEYGLVLADQLRWDKDRKQEARDIYHTLVSLIPDDARVKRELALFLFEEGAQTEAEDYLLQAISQNDPETDPWLAASLITDAYRYGLEEQASALFARIIKLDTKDFWLYGEMGSELTRLGRYEEALGSFEAAGEWGDLAHDQGFLRAVSLYYAQGDTILLEPIASEGLPIYSAAAQVLLALEADGAAAPESGGSYGLLLDEIRKEWGDPEGKRQHYAWLDELMFRVTGERAQ